MKMQFLALLTVILGTFSVAQAQANFTSQSETAPILVTTPEGQILDLATLKMIPLSTCQLGDCRPGANPMLTDGSWVV